MSDRVQLWSSGGGVQSTAIAVLILTGRLPKPDLAVIADTEKEKATTWAYYDTYTRPALAAIGVDLVRAKKSDWRAPDGIYDRKGEKLLMPVYTRQSGTLGKLPTWCSSEWKRDVVRRWANHQRPNSKFTLWIGMSIDEPRRIKPTTGKWQQDYPLFRMRLTRSDCVRLVSDYGWPEAPKSACWDCPQRRHEDWAEAQQIAPEEFEMACLQDEAIREKDPDVYLHEFGIPLRDAIKVPIPESRTLFDTERCDSGYCFV
jgi:hypothetical protein